MNQEQTFHKSVLVDEVLHYLNLKSKKIYIDATFGGGGHTRAILESCPDCQVIAIDWDRNALDKNGAILQKEFPNRLTLIWGNFANLILLLKKEGIDSVDGILADFGTSQYQIFQLPGFSVYNDTPLDMRMAPSYQKVTAQEIINKASADKLEQIFFEYGEERYSKQIVNAIIASRKVKEIKTTGQLVSIIEKTVPGSYKKRKIHPATKVFQALRIYINKELDNIKSFLIASFRVLNNNGRIVCISFHSLEDRIVKQFFKDNSENYTQGKIYVDNSREFKILTSKVVVATQKEIKANPSSRSARLRAAQLCVKI